MNRLIKAVVLVFIVGCLSACSAFWGPDGRRGVSSSLVDYLYPNGELPAEHTRTTPNLRLPLRVGLAFVPSSQHSGLSLPEAKKTELLEGVKSQFSHLSYVEKITVIPEAYLRSSKGFSGIGQVARLYGLDVMALVSYDQVSLVSDTKSSILYWTIAGAYFVKGNQNQATTFVDTAVFDVESQEMLFRAPGVSDVKQSSTLIEVGEVNRAVREKGFALSMQDMSNNLAKELKDFEERVKSRSDVEVSLRQGYGGGGGVQWPLLVVLACLLLIKTARR